jgi:hypothetical protein
MTFRRGLQSGSWAGGRSARARARGMYCYICTTMKSHRTHMSRVLSKGHECPSHVYCCSLIVCGLKLGIKERLSVAILHCMQCPALISCRAVCISIAVLMQLVPSCLLISPFRLEP